MSTTSTTIHYQAILCRLAGKKGNTPWHLGAKEGTGKPPVRERTACGVKLYPPSDPNGGWQESDDLAKIDCGSCKRQKLYTEATGQQTAANMERAASAQTPRRRGRREGGQQEGASGRQVPEQQTATVDGAEAAAMLAAAAEAAAAVNDRPSNGGGDPAVQPKPKRKSRAQRAAELADRDRAAAASQAADATVNAIDAALAGAETVNIDAVAAQAAADQAAGECQADEQ